MTVTPRAPRRRRKAKPTPANWSEHGWPRPEYRLPSPETLERLSREGPLDGDQVDAHDPTDGQLERLRADQADPEAAVQGEFDLGSGLAENETSGCSVRRPGRASMN